MVKREAAAVEFKDAFALKFTDHRGERGPIDAKIISEFLTSERDDEAIGMIHFGDRG